MRLYADEAMERARARKLLVEAKAEGLVTGDQYEHLEQATLSELSTTNLFLRIVLFLFATLCVAAAAGLTYQVFRPRDHAQDVLLLLLAAGCYAGAELAASQARFYHHGIEEALAICSVVFLCLATDSAFGPSRTNTHDAVSLVAGAGAALCLWVWYRFRLWYSFLLVLVFVVFLPTDWTQSPALRHSVIGLIYAGGLLAVRWVRRGQRLEAIDRTYSLAEAFLWLALYLTFNLQLLAGAAALRWFGEPAGTLPFGRTFYWLTWVLTWCLPAVVLVRGIRAKDRFVLVAGAVALLVTFGTNKPYLGWPRHTWDPMVLGAFLIGAALLLRRWLQQGEGRVRYGFTAECLSKETSQWVRAGSSALGFFSPPSMAPARQEGSPDLGLDGGASGGGGASRDF